MKKHLPLLIHIFQFILTFLTAFFVNMIFALFDYKGGLENFVGLASFQPLVAMLFSILTITVCFVIGLPIRLNNKVNAWWINKPLIPIVSIVIGLVMLFLSLTPTFMQLVTEKIDGIDITTLAPNQFLSFVGWFLTSFSTLHFFPSNSLKEKIENKLNSFDK